MSYLTTERVNATFLELLFRPDELENGKPIAESTIVDGVVGKFGFHSGRVEKNKTVIKKLLLDLPDEFHIVGDSGWAFMDLCKDKHGELWADTHLTLEKMICLGLAAGYIEYCLPRSEWRKIVGSPYIRVKALNW